MEAFQFLIGRLSTVKILNVFSSMILCFNSLQVDYQLSNHHSLLLQLLRFNSLQVDYQLAKVGGRYEAIERCVSIPYRQTINISLVELSCDDVEFQFLIGRLSTLFIQAFYSAIIFEFQFLIGRLSTLKKSLHLLPVHLLFQFLIGRLSTYNSWLFYFQLIFVSIPYRQTINLIWFSLINSKAATFQFLIGRLSTQSFLQFSNFKGFVSIPYRQTINSKRQLTYRPNCV